MYGTAYLGAGLHKVDPHSDHVLMLPIYLSENPMQTGLCSEWCDAPRERNDHYTTAQEQQAARVIQMGYH